MPRWQVSGLKTGWATLSGSRSSPATTLPLPPTTGSLELGPVRGAEDGQRVAELAACITQTAQFVRANKDEYALLTKDVDLLQKQVREAFGSSAIDELVFSAIIELLISTLEDIKRFTKKMTRRNILTRMVKKKTDLDEIKTFRKRLHQLQSQIMVQNIDNNVKDVKRLLTNPLSPREEVGIASSSSMDGVGVSGVGSRASGPTTVSAGVSAADIQFEYVEDPQGIPRSEAPYPALERLRVTESSSYNGRMNSTTDPAILTPDIPQRNPFLPNFVASPLPERLRTAPASPLTWTNCEVPSSSDRELNVFPPTRPRYQRETHHLHPYPAANYPYRHHGHFPDFVSLTPATAAAIPEPELMGSWGVQTLPPLPPPPLWPSIPTSIAGPTPPSGTGLVTLPSFDMRRARINGPFNVNLVIGSSTPGESTSGGEPKRCRKWIDNSRAIRRRANRRL
ncbi:hypothetical protein BDN72DRAFT_901047 [Pluteus cervinus]|uniref:Uncharacterized protein n=1 Tax=Pluteus cervinus TaxID=181527 RepID=A0ACD3AGZ1_9AGAR|nr:hypothetical protein BDN72DRAFT_901047 [Pluteus cervinus]